MWAIVELIVILSIVLFSITEFFVPLLLGKPLFGSFRKAKSNPKNSDNTTLHEELKTAKSKVEEIKNLQNDVNQNYKSAEQLKEESDNLLK